MSCVSRDGQDRGHTHECNLLARRHKGRPMGTTEVTLMYRIMLEAWELFEEMNLGRMNNSGQKQGWQMHSFEFLSILVIVFWKA